MAEETTATDTAQTTTQQARPLTIEEANKPILDITGEQALMGADTINPATGETVPGQFDLGQAEYKPEKQTVQEDELLTTTGKTLTSEGVSATASTAATPDSVSVTAQDAAQIDSVERTYSSLPTTTAQQGTVSEGAIIDPNQVFDERTKT